MSTLRSKTTVTSEKQRAMRQRFAACAKFLNPIRQLCNTAYGSRRRSGKLSGVNGVMSHMLTNAFPENSTSINILYQYVRLSKGRLTLPIVKALTMEDNKMQVFWSYCPYELASGNDSAVLLVYSQEKQIFLVNLDQSKRKHGKAEVNIPPEFRHDTLHTYLFFQSSDRKEASNTLYLPPVGQQEEHTETALRMRY